MKKILLVLLCLALAGCLATTKTKNLNQQVVDLQDSVAKKEAEMVRLQGLLADKEQEIKDKDLKIEELKKKLAGFGVF